MTVELLLAPAGAGKTAYAVAQARRQARGLSATPYVLVASALQAQSFRRRLARAGGAIGVRVLTFEELYRLCLSPTDATYSQINDPVRHRVIRSVVRQLPLVHYAPLTRQPGFVQVLRSIIDELKAARVRPDSFAQTLAAHAAPPRLRELADVYAAYQARLQQERWADSAGLGWLAVQALERDLTPLGVGWPLLLVDGFDDFTTVQLALLAALVGRVERIVITLTGTPQGAERPLAHRRFHRTRQDLVDVLGVEPRPLPRALPPRSPVLRHLEPNLFKSDASPLPGGADLELIEAPNRTEEVRAALRWLKAEIVERGASPRELALLARDATPYRPFVRHIAAEFGLPVQIYAGAPLHRNPAVAALLDLLRLMLPVEGPGAQVAAGAESAPSSHFAPEPALTPRLVVEAWRCPYFDWSLAGNSAAEPAGAGSASDVGPASPSTSISIEPGDADALAAVARRGRVIIGLTQWRDAFNALASAAAREPATQAAEDVQDVEDERSPTVLTGARVRELQHKFNRFVHRLNPPQGRHAARDFVRWLESLIGPDPQGPSKRFPRSQPPSGLNVVAQLRAAREPGEEPREPGAERAAPAPPRAPASASTPSFSAAERDLAALRCLKSVLRDLVWAGEALEDPPVTFPVFFEELTAAVEAAFYGPPRDPDQEEILVADPLAARGVPFRSVAVIGLAEGLFPATQTEDPLLHDDDRQQLGLPLEPSTLSAEAEYFYETIAAPSERLLLTRPRLTDEGAPWQPSPFWDEVRRLVDVEPTVLSGPHALAPHRAASWPELFICAGGRPQHQQLWTWLRGNAAESAAALDASARVLTWRHQRADSPFDGALHHLVDHFKALFDADYTWSASRLEAYHTCPFHFFVGKLLGLEPREEPSEGIDWLQRGNLYHEILERVYKAADDPTDLDALLALLPAVAGDVLDRAPEEQGFRRSAWWAQTRREILEDVRRSLEALSDDEQRGGFVPARYEAAFGLWGEPPLVVHEPEGDDRFTLRGLIDRVDRDGQGRVRVIDYKTGGPSSYGNAALRRGDKIQLPLYALAARDALGLGEPHSGFYWHVRHAEPSPFKLEDFGPQEAIETAVTHAWQAIHSARAGRFQPQTPRGGCPSYCPAVGFCWHYEPRYHG